METIYFFIFCLGIGYIIFWALQNDDQAEFTGQERSKKFIVQKKSGQTTNVPDEEQSNL